MGTRLWKCREFLAGTAVPLAGTAMTVSRCRPIEVSALKGASQSVGIPTQEFAGNIDERLDFPKSWELHVMHMRGYGASPLTAEQIRAQLEGPIGTRPMQEIAEGSKTAVIIRAGRIRNLSKCRDRLSAPSDTQKAQIRRRGCPARLDEGHPGTPFLRPQRRGSRQDSNREYPSALPTPRLDQ